MLAFNKKKLLEGYVSRFGPLTNDLADAFAFLFSKIENDNRFNDTDTDRRKLAYCMATFKWETAHTMRPIDVITRKQPLVKCWVTRSPGMAHCFMAVGEIITPKQKNLLESIF